LGLDLLANNYIHKYSFISRFSAGKEAAQRFALPACGMGVDNAH
jgi:hypothetical protein